MAAITVILRAIATFLPFLVRLIPLRVKPAGPIEPLKKEPWAGK